MPEICNILKIALSNMAALYRLSLKGGTGNRGTGNRGTGNIGEYRGIFKRGNIGESLKRGISGNL